MGKNYNLIVSAVCILLMPGLLSAQQYQKPSLGQQLYQSQKVSQFDRVQLEIPSFDLRKEAPQSVVPRAIGEEILGTTQYDLQTNSSTQNRLNNLGDGKFSASWIISNQGLTGWPDRGSAYVGNDGTGWDAEPTARLEAQVRTGWPSLTTTADGTDVIVCHNTTNAYRIHVLRRPAGGSWEEFDLDTDLPLGSLWPKSAVGGPDGNSIHAVAIATPTGTTTNGVVYEGVDGHLLYYRSLDAGANWDKIDVIIPGIDSTEYAFLSADDYSIDVKGNTVAVLVMSPWGDIKVAKSEDNGETWNILTVYDFPLGPAYDLDGYEVDSIPLDTISEDGNAIKSTDGAGTILIDDAGRVHVFYAEVWVSDDAFTDRTWSYFPGRNSINYWNESMDDSGGEAIAGFLDEDGDGEFGVDDIIDGVGGYGQGLASYPTAGIDANGSIYLAYSSVSELYFNENANPGLQHYRHIYLTRSTDGGITWSEPYDIINPDYSSPDFYAFTEGVFPSMAKVVDDYIHIVYQQDFEPGHSVSGDQDDITDNFIIYSAIPVYELTSSKNVVKPSDIGFRAYPNPASSQINFQLASELGGDMEISIFNSTGQLLQSREVGNFPSGFANWTLDISQFPVGLYIARLSIGDTYSSLKFYKQ